MNLNPPFKKLSQNQVKSKNCWKEIQKFKQNHQQKQHHYNILNERYLFTKTFPSKYIPLFFMFINQKDIQHYIEQECIQGSQQNETCKKMLSNNTIRESLKIYKSNNQIDSILSNYSSFLTGINHIHYQLKKINHFDQLAHKILINRRKEFDFHFENDQNKEEKKSLIIQPDAGKKYIVKQFRQGKKSVVFGFYQIQLKEQKDKLQVHSPKNQKIQSQILQLQDQTSQPVSLRQQVNWVSIIYGILILYLLYSLFGQYFPEYKIEIEMMSPQKHVAFKESIDSNVIQPFNNLTKTIHQKFFNDNAYEM